MPIAMAEVAEGPLPAGAIVLDSYVIPEGYARRTGGPPWGPQLSAPEPDEVEVALLEYVDFDD